MQDQPTPKPLRPLDEMERDVLYLLTNEDQPVWTVEDIGRAIDDHIGAIDAVGGLRRAGLLIQTSDGHVFATRAGYRAVAMIGAVV